MKHFRLKHQTRPAKPGSPFVAQPAPPPKPVEPEPVDPYALLPHSLLEESAQRHHAAEGRAASQPQSLMINRRGRLERRPYEPAGISDLDIKMFD